MNRQLVAFCAVLGGLSFIAAFAVYMSEQQKGPADEPNNAPALLLLGVGAFLVLIAVISANGRSATPSDTDSTKGDT